MLKFKIFLNISEVLKHLLKEYLWLQIDLDVIIHR